jgi:hypothetical protein
MNLSRVSAFLFCRLCCITLVTLNEEVIGEDITDIQMTGLLWLIEATFVVDTIRQILLI